MVRSKSEVIIANALAANGVDYTSELPLTINTVTKYPDFTIEDMASGTTWQQRLNTNSEAHHGDSRFMISAPGWQSIQLYLVLERVSSISPHIPMTYGQP